MRVIAGKARSIPLITPEGLNTRPTTDKIKETLFNMLQFELIDCVFLDLFAGSGGIGIEALSRGASYAYFSDISAPAVSCIEKNLAKCRFAGSASVFKADALAALPRIAGKIAPDDRIIVFLDPPYSRGLEFPVLKKMSELKLLKPDDLVIVETALDADISAAYEFGYELIKEKKYKSQKHLFLRQNRL